MSLKSGLLRKSIVQAFVKSIAQAFMKSIAQTFVKSIAQAFMPGFERRGRQITNFYEQALFFISPFSTSGSFVFLHNRILFSF
jgi:hypothetical protein